ncbi:MAG: B12-binding domain-containing radical SAM protein, partial [bacterium]|nr:B12-binding domain-containing radical SAM protein [bacterium]
FDYLFFSAIVVGIDDTLKLVDIVKQKFPHKIVVMGGTFASLEPDYCLSHCSGIDVLILGEGENISPKIIDAYTGNSFEQLDNETGIFYRKSRDARYLRRDGFNLVDLKTLGERALPDWSLLDANQGPHVYRIMTARGCGFMCSFCVPSYMSRHQVRNYDISTIINGIKEVKYKYQAENYVIGDLTFLYNLEHSRELLKRIIREGIQLPFWCQTHLSRVTRENLELLKEAGCTQLAVGVESINPSILHNINKGIDEREIVKKLLLIKEYGIEVQTYFIIGLPGDDRETVALNKAFITYGVEKGYIDRTHIGVYVPYPGVSPGNSEPAPGSYAHYTQGVFRDIPTYPVYEGKTLSREEVKQAYSDCLGEVGQALQKVRKTTGTGRYTNESILLGAEALAVSQRLVRMAKESGRTSVFNLVQGIRKNEEAFVSSSIQEVGEFVFANAEVYHCEEAETVIREFDGKADV